MSKLGRRSLTAFPWPLQLQVLRCYSNVMEGRGDGLKCLNLGCSFNQSSQGLQHFRVSIVVVGLCIGFALPQTDRNHIWTAGI